MSKKIIDWEQFWEQFKDDYLSKIRRLSAGLCTIAGKARDNNEGIEVASRMEETLLEILGQTLTAINFLQTITEGKD